MAKNTVIALARMSTGKVSLTVRYAELAPAEAVNKISDGVVPHRCALAGSDITRFVRPNSPSPA